MSHGCIRLYPEDIALLFELVPLGTPVQVISQSVKIGWYDGELYVEAHPEAEQADELERTGRVESADARSRADALYRVKALAGADQGSAGLAPHSQEPCRNGPASLSKSPWTVPRRPVS